MALCEWVLCDVSSQACFQVVSKHDYSKAADVYSFGIILWEMMTWRLPWEELNPFQVDCSPLAHPPLPL